MNKDDFFEAIEKEEAKPADGSNPENEIEAPESKIESKRLFLSKENIKFEKIYIGYAIAVCFLIGGAYMLLSSLFSPSDTETTKPATSQLHNTPNSVFKAVRTPLNQDSLQVQNHNTELKKSLTELQLQLNTLMAMQKEYIARTEKSFVAIATEIKTLSTTQNKQAESFLEVNNKLTDIKNSDQTKTLIKLAQELQRQIQYMNSKELNLTDKLYLTAVVDGIAWLSDQKGKVLTVKKGSIIDGYGKVLKVDDQHNKVYTESGFVFS